MVLCPVLGKLLHKHVVLASASPRRREILSNAGLRFEVVPSKFKEKLNKASFSTPYAYAVETARQKALEVANRLHQDLRTPDVVIGADTIVAVSGLILEKPLDKQDAYRMLSRLNGKEHSVFTGVAIVHCYSKEGQLDTEVSEFYEETTVKFSELSEELLWEYIHSGEPMDKAGGYGIQALGGMLVEYVHGDFLNVVGFPLNHFCKKLVELYHPPHQGHLQRTRQDSIPPVDTFENPSDVDGDGSKLVQRTVGSKDRTEVGTDHQARGALNTDCNRMVGPLPPFPARLLELVDGFKVSKALFTACRLKVFDVLKGEVPQKAVDVASMVDVSVCGAERLLDVCAILGLLERSERGYCNTELADLYLVSDSEYSLRDFIMHSDQHTWNLFTRLEVAIREGKKAEDLSQDTSLQTREEKLQFLGAMHSLTKLTARHVVTAFDLSQFASACDLGGCTGALARELSREYPDLKVTVVDLPDVIEHVPHFQPDGPETARVSFQAGDFFRDSLPEADLFLLSRVLHDWPDDRVHALLSRVSSSCHPGAGLLLVEAILDSEEQEPRASLTWSLNSLLQTRGRDRCVAEYRALLEQHGFGDVQEAPAGPGLTALLGSRISQ
ncbi:probable bifunctional dTTP/UTP pyrophosphatase/methyltransferase protein isoform X2 [Nycticebus coucang]|uniref:probable bifunctional dTTP/UTP pyrophosphatase/methyltransferase protein isoform X2 n=1 Tax=Nycticebus coucang TaxID=9470 RepID=UPI00234C172F|nr:probable bifunctional dTTP/UTP pyrophosphatase/methyltransferase protein isoform X2 [Nycticebus coucang]